MQAEITIRLWDAAPTPVRAIVRGDLALHVALRRDGRRLNEWAVTHVPTGRQIVVVQGAYAGRMALKELQALSFDTINAQLMRQCNKAVKALRKRKLKVLYPSVSFSHIIRPDLLREGHERQGVPLAALRGAGEAEGQV